MSISLTAKAAARVRDYVSRNNHAIGLRLGVRRSGCSGLTYTVDYAESIEPGDIVTEDSGVKVIVASENLPILDGLCVDYVREGLNEKFSFTNPNVTAQCGCGSSFSVQ
jgi:iron-sulfur cluster assembly protein